MDVRDIISLYTCGIIDKDEARKLLQQIGVKL